MMKFMRKAKGSISIFLILVLLPMVTYATLVIDVSRIQAARTLINGAADLSMNAALSEYEVALQDMYGLFAQVNSEEDLEKALQQYFTETITGQVADTSKDDEFIQQWAGQLTDALLNIEEEDGVSMVNFLEMQLDENAGGFTAAGLNGSALANPAIMKRQIVDYMKYNGPVSMANTLTRKMSFFEGAAKQSEAAEKKIEYTKTLSGLDDPCTKAYVSIVGGNVEGTSTTYEGYKNQAQNYNAIYNNDWVQGCYDEAKKCYEQASLCFFMKNQPVADTKYLEIGMWLYYGNQQYFVSSAHTAITDIEKKPSDTLEESKEKLLALKEKADEVVKFDKGDYGEYEKILGDAYVDGSGYHIDPVNTEEYVCNDLKDIENNLNVEQYITKSASGRMNGFNTALLSDPDKDIKGKLANRYGAEDKMNSGNTGPQQKKFVDFLAYHSYFETLESDYITEYANLEKKFDEKCEEEAKKAAEDDDKDWSKMNKNDKDEYINTQKETGVDGITKTDLDEWKKLRDNLRSFISSSTQTYNLFWTNTKNAVDRSIYDKIGTYYELKAGSMLYYPYHFVKKCEATSKDVIDTLQEVLNSIGKVETAKGQWEQSVNKIPEGTTQASMKSDFQTTTDGLNKTDVTNLQNLAIDCYDYFHGLAQKMETTKFCGKAIYKYNSSIALTTSNRDEFIKNAIEGNYSFFTEFKNEKIFEDKNEVNVIQDLYSRSLNDSVHTFTESHFIFNSDLANPTAYREMTDLDGKDSAGNEIEKEKFFFTLENIANVKEQEMSTDAKKKFEAVQNKSKVDDDGTAKAPGSADSEAQESGSSPEKKQEEKDAEKTSFDFEESLNRIKGYYGASDPGDLNADEYKSGNTEIGNSKKSYKKSADQAGDTVNQGTKILTKIGDAVKSMGEKAYMEEYYTEMFTCYTDIKPIEDKDKNWKLLNGMTAETINSNTQWCGKEIEYLLWGDSNINANLTKNAALIYTIRLAFNTIYAFTASDIQGFTFEVASAIAGWSVIGVPIVQACLTVAIAAAESAYDLHMLKEGEDVPIYKNQSTFVCSPTGLLETVATKAIETAVEKTTKYALSKIDSSIDNLADKGYEKIDNAMGEVEDYAKEYIDAQKESLISGIKDQFVTPIVNKMTPVFNLTGGAAETANEETERAIDNAFTVIEANLNNMPAESMVRDFALQMVTDESFKNDVKTKMTEYMTMVINKSDSAKEDITNYLVGKDGVITKKLNELEGAINDKMDKLKDNIMTNIRNKGDQAIGNLKSSIHEEFDKASEQISGTLTNAVSNTISSYASDVIPAADTSSSGGFTLNYKEYCKIFMLIQLAANENGVMQRGAALMEANVQNATSHANSKFKMTEAYTFVYVNANVKIGTLFDWNVSVDDNNATGQSGVNPDFSKLGDHSVVINYTGVNGY